MLSEFELLKLLSQLEEKKAQETSIEMQVLYRVRCITGGFGFRERLGGSQSNVIRFILGIGRQLIKKFSVGYHLLDTMEATISSFSSVHK